MRILAILFCAFAAPANGQEVARYTYLLARGAIGTETATADARGNLQIQFEFHDRGRTAKLSERIAAGQDAIPATLEINGSGELDAPVDERFSLAQGIASWENRSEKGSKRVSAKAFYVSANALANETALLARALLLAPEHELALLPEGKASIERHGSLTVTSKGRSRTVTQYTITGLGFTPLHIWLTAQRQLFGLASLDYSTIAQGWEAALPRLLEQQVELESRRLSVLAAKLSHRPDSPVAFIHAALFDSETATTSSGRTVLIDEKRIMAVGLDGQVSLPAKTRIIDAAGQTLIPGLWDMHAHLQPEDGLLYLVCGVTSVRDLGNDANQMARLVDRYDRGIEAGPRAVMAGFVNGRGAVKDPTRTYADTPEEARAAVDGFAKRGYLQIKVYSSLDPALLPGIVARAHSLGMRVSGHVPAAMSTTQFVEAGVDEIQHLNFLFLDFLPQRRHVLFTELSKEIAAHGAEVDLRSDAMRSFVRLLQERHVTVDPTVNLFEWLFENRDGEVAPGYAAVAASMPPQARRGFLHGGLPVPEGMDRRYRDSFERMLELIKLLHDEGVPLVAGTDGQVDGFSLHRELELYERAGIPAPEVLQMATLGAARLAKRDRELGSIAAGKLADLVLVEGNPALRMSEIRRVRTVVKDGVFFDAAAVRGALGILSESIRD